jgi:EpsI family protein
VIARAAVVILLLFATGIYVRSADTEARVPRQPIASVPLQIGEWVGRELPPYADDVLQQLGADEYLNRAYVGRSGVPIALYVGYYASQRQGDTIHSPRNCLPGAGWQPVEAGIVPLRASDRAVSVNHYVVQKGLEREVVVYWYQGRGRVTAGEYVTKMWLMLDAARLHRTDGGLVRLIAPIVTDKALATEHLVAFAASLQPYLSRSLP